MLEQYYRNLLGRWYNGDTSVKSELKDATKSLKAEGIKGVPELAKWAR